MIAINLFGSPGVGKSTTAAGLFHLMKLAGFSVELVTEYAKDLVWAERNKTFDDQLYLLAKQNHRLHILRDKVDYLITDSPLLLSNIYRTDGMLYEFKEFVFSLFNSYDNVNLLINRVKPYVEAGRNQTADESDEIGEKIKSLLDSENYFYNLIDGDENATKKILEMIQGTFNVNATQYYVTINTFWIYGLR